MTRPRPAPRVAAAVDPVARVMVDVPLPHLDRPFDYLVAAEFDEQVQAGSRVRVRFAGRLVDGYVLDRRPSSEHANALAFLDRPIGVQPVLTDETAALFRAVADRYAGSFVDVARLGVPPRHARTEAAPPTVEVARTARTVHSGWDRYHAGGAFMAAVGAARPARAVWSALPGEDWPARIAEVIQTALAAGRGAVAIVPDGRDLARVDAALLRLLGDGRHVALSAELGPAERYRRWLAVRRGVVQAVVGTRAAGYAPVVNPGVLIIWDDGDDLHREPRAPYPDARDVLVLRSSLTGAALLVGGYARTAEAQLLLESGWAHEITADRGTLRAVAPRVVAAGDDVEQARDPAARAARLPSLAWRAAGKALADGQPVLVQVPRRGYVPSLACVRDRTPARCATCAGPLAMGSAQAIASCRWCGRPAGGWACPTCAGRKMRALVVGAGRTAEELGRAFPGTLVRTSGRDQVLDTVDGRPALVVSTPGAEPVAEGGYGAALLLDGWAMLARPDLRAGEEALRRWLNAAALVCPGGQVVVVADAGIPVVQALVRWDPAGSASRELAERSELGFPPAVRMAALSGRPDAVLDFVQAAELPAPHEMIGPVPTAPSPTGGDSESVRMLIRVPREDGARLATALRAAAAGRSARKATELVKIVLDPAELF
ncbi:MAG TPA: primosomal protein N' [Jatrophihabitantaceae bacterium]|nr:primosomal protein N' [Jatrophihabitantaceae bacterium]